MTIQSKYTRSSFFLSSIEQLDWEGIRGRGAIGVALFVLLGRSCNPNTIVIGCSTSKRPKVFTLPEIRSTSNVKFATQSPSVRKKSLSLAASRGNFQIFWSSVVDPFDSHVIASEMGNRYVSVEIAPTSREKKIAHVLLQLPTIFVGMFIVANTTEVMEHSGNEKLIVRLQYDWLSSSPMRKR